MNKKKTSENMRKSGKRHGGFTLIELLVVIAIISLLVSILLPSLQKAKDMARITVCLSQWHSVGLTTQLYAEDYGEYLPFPYDYVNWRSWKLTFEKFGYINKDDPMLYCPAAADERHPRWGYLIDGGYGMAQEWESRDPSGSGKPRWHPNVVKDPSGEVVFSDSRASSTVGPLLDNVDVTIFPSIWGGGNPQDAQCSRMSTRHMGSPNILFLDWHSEHISVEQATKWSDYWIDSGWNHLPQCWHPGQNTDTY